MRDLPLPGGPTTTRARRLGAHRHHVDRARGRRRRHDRGPPPRMRFIAAGRRNPDDRDGDGGRAAAAGAGRRRASRSKSHGPRAFRDRSRAPARSAITSSSPSGFRRSVCCRRRLELPSVSRQHGVLLRLRPLRRPAHGAPRLDGRRDRRRATRDGQRRSARRRIATTRTTSTTLRGRRAPTT